MIELEAILDDIAGNVVRTDKAGWHVASVDGPAVRAHVAEGWLDLTAALPVIPVDADPWTWLRFNHSLHSRVYAALAPGERAPHLRGAVQLDDDPGSGEDIVRLCHELRAAWHLALRSYDPAPDTSSISDGGSDGSEAIERFCAEAKWSCVRSDAGDLHVDLDSGVGVGPARLWANGGIWGAVVTLADVAPYSAASRRAIEYLLLMTSATVRTVKGVWSQRDDRELVALASATGRPHSAEELERALSALAIGCRLVWREVLALRDEDLARQVLIGWNVEGQRETNAKEECACLQS